MLDNEWLWAIGPAVPAVLLQRSPQSKVLDAISHLSGNIREKRRPCPKFTQISAVHPRDQHAAWNPNVGNEALTQPSSSSPVTTVGATPSLSHLWKTYTSNTVCLCLLLHPFSFLLLPYHVITTFLSTLAYQLFPSPATGVG